MRNAVMTERWGGNRVKKPRNNQIVDSAYLRRVAIRCSLIFLAGLVATGALYLVMMKQPIGPTYGEGFRLLAQLEQDIFYKSLLIYGSTVLVCLFCIIILTMLYSHRVAGPVYRLRIFAGQVRKGDLSSAVSLRESDVIHSLSRDMNSMVGVFHGTVSEIDKQMREIENLTGKLAQNEPFNSENRKKIAECADAITSTLSHYKL